MKEINLNYDSSEIEISTFLLSFFKISGINVCEKFTDFSKKQEIFMLSSIDEKNNISTEVIKNINFYIISKENLYQLNSVIKQMSFSSKINCLIYKQGILTNSDKIIVENSNAENIVFSDKKQLLNLIIEFLYCKRIIDIEEKKDLNLVVECFLNYKISDLLTISKSFYKKNNDENYKKLSENYIDAIKFIPSDIFDTNYWHSQYARLYLGYEVNLLCKNFDKRLICSNEYIEKKLKILLSKQKYIDDNQIIMLLAQTYDDLFLEYNVAYEYYISACSNKNAFAYFKRGEYWNKYGNKTEEAIKYYEKSISLCPEYYKAWYNLGISYFSIKNMSKALDAFENVNIILNKKKMNHNLNQIDIEYLYKACNLCGYIYNKFYFNYSKSIKYNLLAVEIWQDIDKSTTKIKEEFKYYYMIDNDNFKRKFNIEKTNDILYCLFEKIGNKDLAENFREKIQIKSK